MIEVMKEQHKSVLEKLKTEVIREARFFLEMKELRK